MRRVYLPSQRCEACGKRGSHRSETAECGVTAAHWSVNADPHAASGRPAAHQLGGKGGADGGDSETAKAEKKRKALVCTRGVAELWLHVHSSLEAVRARWSAPSHHLHFISLTALYSYSTYNLTVNLCFCCATGLICSHRDFHSEILHFQPVRLQSKAFSVGLRNLQTNNLFS